MSAEVIPWVLSVIVPISTAIGGYYLGLRSQKTQILREYVKETVKEYYPPMLLEIQRNTEYLDGYLEYPFKDFQFSVLADFLKKGYGSLMKKHHADLFESVSYFSDKIKPRILALNTLRGGVHDKLFQIWKPYLYEELPAVYKNASESIAGDLIRSVGRDTVLAELLKEDYDSMATKVERCIEEKTTPFRDATYRKSPFYELKGIPVGEIDHKKITKSLIEKAKPTIEEILKAYNYAKEQNDKETKGKILPLLQKYISNPI